MILQARKAPAKSFSSGKSTETIKRLYIYEIAILLPDARIFTLFFRVTPRFSLKIHTRFCSVNEFNRFYISNNLSS